MSKFIPKNAVELEYAKTSMRKSMDEWYHTKVKWPHPVRGPMEILQGKKAEYDQFLLAVDKVVDGMTHEEMKKFLAANGVF